MILILYKNTVICLIKGQLPKGFDTEIDFEDTYLYNCLNPTKAVSKEGFIYVQVEPVFKYLDIKSGDTIKYTAKRIDKGVY